MPLRLNPWVPSTLGRDVLPAPTAPYALREGTRRVDMALLMFRQAHDARLDDREDDAEEFEEQARIYLMNALPALRIAEEHAYPQLRKPTEPDPAAVMVRGSGIASAAE